MQFSEAFCCKSICLGAVKSLQWWLVGSFAKHFWDWIFSHIAPCFISFAPPPCAIFRAHFSVGVCLGYTDVGISCSPGGQALWLTCTTNSNPKTTVPDEARITVWQRKGVIYCPISWNIAISQLQWGCGHTIGAQHAPLPWIGLPRLPHLGLPCLGASHAVPRQLRHRWPIQVVHCCFLQHWATLVSGVCLVNGQY